MANIIYRGTTPTITITLPASMNLNEFDVAYLTFSTDTVSTILEKDISSMQIGATPNVSVWTLTQADTLSFEEDTTVSYQLRLRKGTEAYATRYLKCAVGPIIKEGEI